MKISCLILFAFLLSGCVDLGHVTLHPTTQTGYFTGHRYGVEQCLEVAALNQQLRLERDDPLPGGTDRFNLLNSRSEVVAWIEVAKFSRRETSAQFYYAPQEPEISSAVTALIAQCGSLRE